METFAGRTSVRLGNYAYGAGDTSFLCDLVGLSICGGPSTG